MNIGYFLCLLMLIRIEKTMTMRTTTSTNTTITPTTMKLTTPVTTPWITISQRVRQMTTTTTTSMATTTTPTTMNRTTTVAEQPITISKGEKQMTTATTTSTNTTTAQKTMNTTTPVTVTWITISKGVKQMKTATPTSTNTTTTPKTRNTTTPVTVTWIPISKGEKQMTTATTTSTNPTTTPKTMNTTVPVTVTWITFSKGEKQMTTATTTSTNTTTTPKAMNTTTPVTVTWIPISKGEKQMTTTTTTSTNTTTPHKTTNTTSPVTVTWIPISKRGKAMTTMTTTSINTTNTPTTMNTTTPVTTQWITISQREKAMTTKTKTSKNTTTAPTTIKATTTVTTPWITISQREKQMTTTTSTSTETTTTPTTMNTTSPVTVTWITISKGEKPMTTTTTSTTTTTTPTAIKTTPTVTEQPMTTSQGGLEMFEENTKDLLWNMVPDMSLTQKDPLALSNIPRVLKMKSVQGPAGRTSNINQPELLYPSESSGYRTRKEYRTLTPREREKFHKALNRVYKDGYIDTFAKIHARVEHTHHNGSSFLPWHRVYITMFEEYLRIYDPSVSLPYWASKFDDAMDNPVNSILWTPEYYGNGDGIVTSGPAAYWDAEQGKLERGYGINSSLFKEKDIRQVLTQCRLANISRPTAEKKYDLERYHTGPHLWVGGDMSAFRTTGYDPLFYMHHAYVDYIWEQFRQRQRNICGTDPSTDYPDVPVGDGNHPDAPMTGFTKFKNKDGIKSYWTDSWFGYAPEPRCPDCCPKCPTPAPLYCDHSRNACVSRSKPITSQGRNSGAFAAPVAPMVAVPVNRGRLFQGPPSDGRTRFTAFRDARAAAALQAARKRLQTFV